MTDFAGISPQGVLSAVVIAYRPRGEALERVCGALRDGGLVPVVVDNTPATESSGLRLPEGVECISLGRNTGIARAQNIGIAHALGSGAAAVMILDQDSQITAECVAELVRHLRLGEPMIVAPRIIDDRVGVEFPAERMTSRGSALPVPCGNLQAPVRVDLVMASGTFATREAIEKVGLMDEGLFIDYVDTVWSLRCWKSGLPVWVIPTALLRHRIGSEVKLVGGTWIQVHSPLRCYYQFRNVLLLLREGRAPWRFAVRAAASLAWSRILLLRIVGPKMPYLRAYLIGLAHGVRGISGEASARVKDALADAASSVRTY